MRGETRAGAVMLLGLLALAGSAVLAQEQDDLDAYEDAYAAGDYGRVRYQENGVTIVRTTSDLAGGEEAPYEINAPLFPGDKLRTGLDQRVEIQLADGSLLRIDRASELTLLALPRPYADYADNTVVQLASGALRLTTSLEPKEELRVDTAASSIYVLGDADLRVEVDDRGGTRVWSRRGVVEVVGAGGSVLVRGGMQTDVEPGETPNDPYPFNTFASDRFDRWVEQREATYVVHERQAGGQETYRALPDEVRPYYGELTIHGSFIQTADYGYVWCPRGTPVGWRPYLEGSWSYGPGGYFWVSNEPWGWAPYHYGRWTWLASNGWCWIPGRVFGGAWVSWSWGPSYIGWSPLDYWNRPVFVSVVHHHYYDPYAWTFVHYSHFGARDCARHAVPVDRVGDGLDRAAVGTRAPRVGPRRLVESAEARERAMTQVRGRVAPTSRERAVAARSFDRVEERLVPRTARRDLASRAGSYESRTLKSESSPGQRPPLASSGRRSPVRPEAAPAQPESGGAAASRFPRRLSAPRGEARQPRPEAVAPSDTGAAPQRPAEGATSERLRHIYRRMALPRETRAPAPDAAAPDRREEPATPPSAPRRPPVTERRPPSTEPARPRDRSPAPPPAPRRPPPAEERKKAEPSERRGGATLPSARPDYGRSAPRSGRVLEPRTQPGTIGRAQPSRPTPAPPRARSQERPPAQERPQAPAAQPQPRRPPPAASRPPASSGSRATGRGRKR